MRTRPPLVTVRMPSFLAHSLSHALSEFTGVCELVEASGRIGWQQYAGALHRAARHAGGGAGCRAAAVAGGDR